MTPVESFEKGLSDLHCQIHDQKTRLEGELKAARKIDEEWLDRAGPGNLVDEERLVVDQDHASDYERGFQGLNPHDPSTLPISSPIHPSDSDTMNNPAAHAEALVEEALDRLEAIGALQHSNRMTITELLDPEDETDDMVGVTPDPTHREALQAALTLRKYVGTFEGSYARKLEVMLGSFGQRTRVIEMQAMKDTKLTDYFTRTT